MVFLRDARITHPMELTSPPFNNTRTETGCSTSTASPNTETANNNQTRRSRISISQQGYSTTMPQRSNKKKRPLNDE